MNLSHGYYSIFKMYLVRFLTADPKHTPFAMLHSNLDSFRQDDLGGTVSFFLNCNRYVVKNYQEVFIYFHYKKNIKAHSHLCLNFVLTHVRHMINTWQFQRLSSYNFCFL